MALLSLIKVLSVLASLDASDAAFDEDPAI
jgi:hypothetical protein